MYVPPKAKESIQPLICCDDYIAAFSTVTSIGTAHRDELFSTETDAAVPAAASLNEYFRFVEKERIVTHQKEDT
jgi:hypothetical protein